MRIKTTLSTVRNMQKMEVVMRETIKNICGRGVVQLVILVRKLFLSAFLIFEQVSFIHLPRLRFLQLLS